jgi:hypothetical protein
MTDRALAEDTASEFAESIRRGLLIGAAALVLILPPALHFAPHGAKTAAPPSAPQVAKPAAPSVARSAPAAPPRHVVRHADFGAEAVSPDVRRMADWVADSRDNGPRTFVIIDKPAAKVYLFDPQARLKAASPTVIGSYIGDDTVPGSGDKPLSALHPEERTTGAGRYVAEVGETLEHEDVVWVDYDTGLAMHRVIKVPERLKALATPSPADNRLSNGCINLPDAFYERQLRPAIDGHGLVVYILPETRPLTQTFASFYDVDAPARLAQN